MTGPNGLPARAPARDTRQRLLERGLMLMLERGYNDTGLQQLLEATAVPKGSFYHHFGSKEEFALAVLELYMADVHAQLDATLLDDGRPPLARVRRFFELTREAYASQGHLGCFFGTLGQELAGVNEQFRRRVAECLAMIAGRIAACFAEARARGELPAETDPAALADLVVDSWEGAALRTRLLRSTAPLDAVLDYYLPGASTA